MLDVTTIMHPEKRLAKLSGVCTLTGDVVTGYEIHIGKTEGTDCARAWLEMGGNAEGAASKNGRIFGCYMHGLFAEDNFRAAFMNMLGISSSVFNYDARIELVLDDLATHIEAYLDMDKLLALAE